MKTAKEIGKEPAFPEMWSLDPLVRCQLGMTYRQWLIGMALQGMVMDVPDKEQAGHYAEAAVLMADAVLAQLAAETVKEHKP